ncbi:ESF1-like protein, partial [Euroglyphus maynei]
KHLIAEDYKEFYQLDNEDVDKSKEQEKIDQEPEDKIDQKKDLKLAHKFGYHRGLKTKSNDSDDDDDDQLEDEDESSSSSSESEDDGDDDEELEHDWGELDKDAQQIDHATARIAICNADWDRINAQDLYILLNSFKCNTGTIKSVKIFYSKFGEERLQVEEEKGPSEFIFGKGQIVTEIDDDDDDDGNEQKLDDNDDDDDEENEDEEIKNPNTVEKLRKYQLERLKYFYAVVECDSAETAEIITNELDGLEYECSSTMLDIRFVPDDMDFDDVRLKEECTTMPTTSTYKAPSFTNTALQQSNVKITWDETDPRRKEAFNKAFEEDNENDIKTYL